MTDKPLTDYERGFRAGFEHALAGGEDAGTALIGRETLPVVLYFKTEADRREMIDAIHMAKPGMVSHKVPERRK